MKKLFKYILIFLCVVFYITFISGMIYQNFVREHFIPPAEKSKLEHDDP
ncbi:hypothetical protein P4493_22315 [Bacillus thuringiensis]|nr:MULTISPECIES: hypothetical protein [Bacillus]MCU5404641.1 hypothetical protein [Bacillus cereus]MCC4013024.1 hypothetical protein [Bacillus thuringiensis]MCC4033391.1 hypothetical protein [Bacillus thuringiensis]MCR6820351.1 hypothetical protein [Bacillus thuringiensis]MEB4830835.1 hypothetical protein [Bacillus thuringiensis]